MMRKQAKFAFLVHPTSLESFYFIAGQWFGWLKMLPPLWIKEILKLLPPYVFVRSIEVKSILNNKVDGFFVLCPLLPEHFVILENKIVLKKILSGVAHAQRLGANLVGLGGFVLIFSFLG